MTGKGHILIAAEHCSGCMRCALACSFFTSPEKAFSLSQSKILIVPYLEEGRFDVRLTDECTRCGICVSYCEFGVLSQRRIRERSLDG